MSDGPLSTAMPYSNVTSSQWSVDSESPNEEASEITAFAYFFIIWTLLLLSILALIVIVCMRNRGRRRQEQEHSDNAMMEEGRTEESNTDLGQKSTRNTHSGVLTLTSVNAAVALILSVYSITTCEFLQASDGPISMSFLPLNTHEDPYTIEVYSLGLWSLVANSNAPGYLEGDLYGEVEACFELSSLFYLDGYYKMARASAVIASLVGGLAFLTMLVLSFDYARLRRFSRLLAWSFGIVAVFQLLTLSILGSGYCDSAHCQIHVGGTSAFTAVAYWMFCTFAILAV